MTPPAVDIRGVSKRYGGVLALDGLDLCVGAGQIVALVGPAGAGKTTVARTVAAVLRPDAGQVTVCGLDAVRDPRSVRRLIAVVDPAGVGLWEQLRRIRLSMVLSAGPRLVVLDEPAVALEPAVRRHLWAQLEAMREHAAVLVTTAEAADAQELADRVVMITHGRAVAEGSPGQLLDRLPCRETFRVYGGGGGLELSGFGVVEVRGSVTVVFPADEDATAALAGALMRAGVAFAVERATLSDVYRRLCAA